jgi:hypothetical protein
MIGQKREHFLGNQMEEEKKEDQNKSGCAVLRMI